MGNISKIQNRILTICLIVACLFAATLFPHFNNIFSVRADETESVSVWDGTYIDDSEAESFCINKNAFSGTGTEDDPFLLQSASDLARLLSIRNLQSNANLQYYFAENIFYLLTTNIDLNNNIWDGIGTQTAFSGHFNGNNKKIFNLQFNFEQTRLQKYGFFDDCDQAEISNLQIVNCSAEINNTRYGISFGILCGYAKDTSITNCSVISNNSNRNTINISSGVNGNVSLSSSILSCFGGLVGFMTRTKIDSSITNCFIDKTDLTISMHTVSSSISQPYVLGGLCGYIKGISVSNCYITHDCVLTIDENIESSYLVVGGLTGEATGYSQIEKCFSKAVIMFSDNAQGVNANNFIGGLVGYLDKSLLTNSFCRFYTQINDQIETKNSFEFTSGTDVFGGLVGYAKINLAMKDANLSGLLINNYVEVSFVENDISSDDLVGFMIGKLLSGDDSEHEILVTGNYFFNSQNLLTDKNSQVISMFNYENTADNGAYNSDNCNLNCNDAKVLSHFVNWSKLVWANDQDSLNDGYPIIRGVGNDLMASFEARIGEQNYATLADAFDAANLDNTEDTIYILVKKISTLPLEVKSNITLLLDDSLTECTLLADSSMMQDDYLFSILSNANLEIGDDSGKKINLSGKNTYSDSDYGCDTTIKNSNLFFVDTGSQLTLMNDVVISGQNSKSLCNISGDLIINSSSINHNTVETSIFTINESGSLTISKASIVQNSIVNNMFYITSGGKAIISGSSVANNKQVSTGEYGLIYIGNGTNQSDIKLQNVQIIGNEVNASGLINCKSEGLLIEGGIFKQNSITNNSLIYASESFSLIGFDYEIDSNQYIRLYNDACINRDGLINGNNKNEINIIVEDFKINRQVVKCLNDLISNDLENNSYVLRNDPSLMEEEEFEKYILDKNASDDTATALIIKGVEYTIDYNLDGGQSGDDLSITSTNYSFGDAKIYISTNTITKQGYIFDGWIVEVGNSSWSGISSLTAGSEIDNSDGNLFGNISLKAQWTAGPSEYTIKYYIMTVDGIYNTEPDELYVNDQAITGRIINIERTNPRYYISGGIEFDDSKFTATAIENGNTVTLSYNNLVVYANGSVVISVYYKRLTHNVTLNAATGVYDLQINGETTSNKDIYYGASYTISCQIKDGYNWNGWTDGTNTYLEKGNQFTMDVGDVTLSATANPITYKIHFVSNIQNYDADQNGLMSDQILLYDKQDKLKTNEFVQKGYGFSNWNTEADGTGTTYLQNQDVLNLTKTDKDVITLFAIWEIGSDTPYKIKYYLMDTDGAYPSEVSDDKIISLTGRTNDTIDVNNINGVNYADNNLFTGFSFDNKNAKNKLSGTITADGTLVLKLYYVREKHTLTINLGGGSIVLQDKTYTGQKCEIDGYYGSHYYFYEPTEDGKIFVEWETTSNNLTSDPEHKKYTYNFMLEDEQITAKWEQKKYTLYFDDNIDNNYYVESLDSLQKVDVYIGQAVGESANRCPSKTGYRFIGWVTSADSDAIISAETIYDGSNFVLQSNGNSIVYGKWIIQYSLKINNNFDGIELKFKVNNEFVEQKIFDCNTEVTIFVNTTSSSYLYESIFENGKKLTESSTYKIVINKDRELTVMGKAQLTIEDSLNGTLEIYSEDGNIIDSSILANMYFYYGSKIKVKAVPNKGYKLKQFSNVSNAANGQGEVVIRNTTTIGASFESKPVIVNASVSKDSQNNNLAEIEVTKKGGISQTQYEVYDWLSIKTFNIIEGYEFSKYTIQSRDNGSTEDFEYQITPDDAERGKVDIQAVIKIKICKIQIMCNDDGGEGGTYKVNGEYRTSYFVEYGGTLQVSIVPYEMYKYYVSLNDQSNVNERLEDNVYTIAGIKKDLILTIKFLPLMWSDDGYYLMLLGKGTKNKPYIITNAKELAFMSYAINNHIQCPDDCVDYGSAYYQLQNDIDLTGRFFDPIGNNSNGFNATFDFNYYKINGVSTLQDSNDLQYGGLFKYIKNGKVLNQFKSNTVNILLIVGIIMIIAGTTIFVILLEKKRRRPKKIFILPTQNDLNNSKSGNSKLKRPNISKFKK